MEEILENALAIIGAITAAGELKIRLKLKSLSDEERREVIALMQRADHMAWFWQSSWKNVGRAYLLANMSNWISAMGYAPPRDAARCLTRWLQHLQASSELLVRRSLTDVVTTRAILQAITVAQRDISREAWKPGHFTDPCQHNPSNFQYFVHAMRPTTGLGTPSVDTAKMFAHIEDNLSKLIVKGSDKTWTLRSAELYLRNPSLIHAEMLSCSIMSHSWKKLYGNFCFGFILRVPSENVCIASPSDLAIANGKARACVLAMQPSPLHRILQVDDFLENLLGLYQQPLPAPSAILSGCTGKGHNEVVILGSTGANFVQVAAIFIKVTSANKLWKSFAAQDAEFGLRELMLLCAKSLSIPIVAIQDDEDKEGTGIDFGDWLSGRATTSSKPSAPVKKVVPQTSSLVIGNHISTYQEPGLIREYMMPQIRLQAQHLLAQGRTPEQVHRSLHDDEGVPHEVVQHVLNGLGHRNYM